MSYPSIGKQFAGPIGVAVISITAIAWYVSLETSDSLMTLLMLVPGAFSPAELALFFGLMTVMMVAMMLPATLPMILGYRALLKSSRGRSTGAPGRFGTLAFVAPYVLIWGGFGAVALLGLNALGLMGTMSGFYALVPGVVLVGAGSYQATSVKRVCLTQCQSPFGFVIGRWRSGLMGAFRMGMSHAKFCVGCCWMFMLALFVSGAMSLVWMGAVSILIFVEKVGIGRSRVPQVIGILLVGLGAVAVAQALIGM